MCLIQTCQLTIHFAQHFCSPMSPSLTPLPFLSTSGNSFDKSLLTQLSRLTCAICSLSEGWSPEDTEISQLLDYFLAVLFTSTSKSIALTSNLFLSVGLVSVIA